MGVQSGLVVTRFTPVDISQGRFISVQEHTLKP